jgi:transposase
MQKYRDMLKICLRDNASCNAIAKSRGISHHTVRRWRDIAHENKLTALQLDAMTDTQLRAVFYPNRGATLKIQPDYARESEYRTKGYNLLECHAHYTEQVGERAAISYSYYCQGMRGYERTKAVIFRHTHPAGYAMQTDFAGYRPEGLEQGSKRKFELFLAVLPLSHYTFACVVRTQSTGDHIEANIAAFEFFGGAPEIVVPDNLKAAVISRPHHGPPVANDAFMGCMDYYGVRIEPARVRHPKDKAAVEIAVKLVQRVLRLRLKAQPLMQLHDINIIVSQIVAALNAKIMRRGAESRLQRFDRLERDTLQPLPPERMQFTGPPVERRVQTDHHISFDKVYYSVPRRLTGKAVTVRASSKVIEIRHDGQIVAIHPRCYKQEEFVTVDAHRPSDHRAYLDISFETWRNALPPAINVLVTAAILASPPEHREQQRIMERVRRLIRLYGTDRLKAAIATAKKADALTIKNVGNILQNRLDAVGSSETKILKPTKPKSNVRGADYYKRDLKRNGGAVQ